MSYELPGGVPQGLPQADYYIPQWEERTSYGVRRVDPFGEQCGEACRFANFERDLNR